MDSSLDTILFIAIFLAATFVAALVTGLAGFAFGLVAAAVLVAAPASQAQVETTDPEIVSGTLARVKKTGVVRIGYREASIPFSFLDRSGRPIGYSIELCDAVVEEIGRTLDRDDLKVEFVKVKLSAPPAPK